jgi:hypothetical protein
MNEIKNSCRRKAPTVSDAETAVPYSRSSKFQLKPLDLLSGRVSDLAATPSFKLLVCHFASFGQSETRTKIAASPPIL